MKNIRKSIFMGGVVFVSLGTAIVSAFSIPGITEPYDPPDYYSETSISYPDSPSPFAMTDLARNGFQVKDVTRGLKNAISSIKTYTQVVIDETRLNNKIIDMTGLPSATSTALQSHVNTVMTETANIDQSSNVGYTATQTLFRTSQTVGDPTLSFSDADQIKYLSNIYKNDVYAAKANLADTEDRAAGMQNVLAISSNANGRLAAQEADTEMVAVNASEDARKNALMATYISMEAANTIAEQDKKLAEAKVAGDTLTFRVADPYNMESTDVNSYTRPSGNGFVDF
jgi:hypothetical protein